MFHSEGLGLKDGKSLALDKLNGSVRILYASDGKVIVCENAFVLSNGLDNSDSLIEGDKQKSAFPDNRYWSLSGETVSTDGAIADVDWPVEEEEKYLSTLRLLIESNELNIDLNQTKSNDVAQTE